MSIALIILLSIPVLGAIALIKNQINYSIRIKWLDEIFDDSDWHEKHKLFYQYDYNKTFMDIKLWRYVPFDEYIKKQKK